MNSKWAEIINDQGTVGVLWVSGNDFGFVANPTPNNKHFVWEIDNRKEILRNTTFTSETKYEILFDYINTVANRNCIALVSEGDNEELVALVSAATPKQYSAAELQGLLQPAGEYSITYDDESREVLGLVWDDNGEVFVRENGEWVVPVDEDERIYGGSLIYVNEDATELFDKLVQDENTPNLESFKEVSLG